MNQHHRTSLAQMPATMKNGLLIGLRTEDLSALARSAQSGQIELLVAIGFEEVKRLCAKRSIDFVFLGCELDPEDRLKTLGHILSASPATQIHVMGQDGNPVAFVTSILEQVEAE